MNVLSVQVSAATAIIESANNLATTTATQTSTSTSAEDAYTSDIAAIAAKYDPTNIPLSQVADLSKALYNKGLISINESVLMMGLPQRVELVMNQGLTIGGLNVRTDGTVNLLAFYDKQRSSQPNPLATQTSSDIYNVLNEVAAQNASTGITPAIASTTTSTQAPLNIRGDIYNVLNEVAAQNASTGITPAIASTTTSTQAPLNIRGAISAYQSDVDQSTFDSQKIFNILKSMAVNRA